MNNSGSTLSNQSHQGGRVEQHSLLKTILLHLLPAVPVFVFYWLTAPAFVGGGLPPGIALLVGFILFGIPFELGYLLYLGKQMNGALSLRGVVLYREPMAKWLYAVLFILLLAFAFLMLFLTAPLKEYLAGNVFYWMPVFMLPDGADAYPPFSHGATLVYLIMLLIFDGIVNPTVEELYFRGYLLPRIEWMGWLAPLASAFLFAVQHYWQPFNWPLIFLIQIAVVYVAWWKRNIYISILAHCAGNVIGALLSLIGFLSS